MSRIPTHRPPQGTPTGAQRADHSSPLGASAAHETLRAAAGSPLRTPPPFEGQGVFEADAGLNTPSPGAGRGRAASVAAPQLQRSTVNFRRDLPSIARSSRFPVFPEFSSEEGFSTPASNFSQPARNANLLPPRHQPPQRRLLNATSQPQRLNVERRDEQAELTSRIRAASILMSMADRPAASADLHHSGQQAQEHQQNLSPPPPHIRLPLLHSPGSNTNQAADLPAVQAPFPLAPRPTKPSDLNG